MTRMNLRSLAPLLAAASLVLDGACNVTLSGNGVAKEETRDLPLFNEVEVSGAFAVAISNDGLQSIKLSGDGNLLPLIKTEVVGKRLLISRIKPFNTVRDLHLEVTLPKLLALSASGASTITATAVETGSLTVEASGASNITVKGKAARLNVKVSGASSLVARELKSDLCTVDGSGASSVVASCAKELSATLTGASKATIGGGPRKVTQDVATASTLEME